MKRNEYVAYIHNLIAELNIKIANLELRKKWMKEELKWLEKGVEK